MIYSLVRCCACEDLRKCVSVKGHFLCKECLDDPDTVKLFVHSTPYKSTHTTVKFLYPYSPN